MRRIAIVFAETDDNTVEQGQGFQVFLEGHDPARMSLPDSKLSGAEFWARRCFSIVCEVLKQSGAGTPSIPD